MLKSFSDSICSLWRSKTPDDTSKQTRKRKRSSEEVDFDDSDVEILSVKKPRQASTSSSSGLFSFLAMPMSKMSDWVRKKTVRQDHVFVKPVPQAKDVRGKGAGQEHGLHQHTSTDVNSLTTTNQPHGQNTSPLSRLPLHSQNGAHENGMNGDVHIVDFQPANTRPSLSRRSSCSSSVRQLRGRPTTVEQCIQLKEKEDFRKLLQQYTTIDLGYSNDRKHTNTGQPSSAHACHTHRNASPSWSSPVLTSLPSSSSFNSQPPSTRLRMRPHRFSQSPLLPSSRVGDPSMLTTWSDVSLSARRQLLRNQHARSLPISHMSQQGKSNQDGEGHEANNSPQLPGPDPDVIIVEDSNGSTDSQSPSLKFQSSHYLDENWINRLNSRYASAERERQRLIEEAEEKKKMLEETREGRLGSLDKRLRQQMILFDGEVEVFEDISPPGVTHLPELTDSMQMEIDAALDNGPQNEVLSQGFRLQLTRGDFATLRGLNWLNDEVINFYMNMLMERGEQEGFSKTYACNTFFYPKLIGGGHDAVRRWTRKVDVFSHHYLVIPVHLGVHWCLCVVFMKEKCVRYYDSMGGDNNQCLNAVRQYLYDESLQKRKLELDLSEWSTETVKDIPQQMNGSDCGMFSCMYAESLTRGAKITFTQEDMPYFRRRMVYELLKKQLL